MSIKNQRTDFPRQGSLRRSRFQMVSALIWCVIMLAFLGCQKTEQPVPENQQMWDWLWEIPVGARNSPSKYESVEAWVQAGRQLGDIEGMLIDFHKKQPDYGWVTLAALGYVGSERSVPVLIEALKSKDDQAVKSAVESLGLLGSKAAIDPLTKLALSTQDGGLVANCAISLAHIGDISVKPTIEQCLARIEHFGRSAQRKNDRNKENIKWALDVLNQKQSPPISTVKELETIKCGRASAGKNCKQIDQDDWAYGLVDEEDNLICLLFLKRPQRSWHDPITRSSSTWMRIESRKAMVLEREIFELSDNPKHRMGLFYISTDPDSIELNTETYNLCAGNIFLLRPTEEGVEIIHLKRIIRKVDKGDFKTGIKELAAVDQEIASFLAK